MEGEIPVVQKAPVQEMQSVSLNPQDQPPSSSVPHIELSEEDEKRYQIVRSIGEECLKDNELRNLLAKKPNPICYDGFEPSGRMHIAQGIMEVINVNKLTSAGCQVKIWIADWFAQLNNKMGGDLKKIEVVGKYFIEIWRAAGMNSINDKVTFLWSSEEINSRADEYWPLVMDIARRNTLARVIRCSQIMGLSETDDLTAAQILYPCMQCADIFFLKADICQLGMDQREVNVLAREYCEQIKRKNKPIILSHRMLPGLQQGQEKMSKSDLSSSIFMEDEEAEVNVKIKKAFCPPNIVEKNPCLEYVKDIVLPWFNEFKVERREKNGGDKTYKSFEEIVSDYESGKLHPADLKPALTKAINTILQPVRDHFKNNAEAKNILKKVKKSTSGLARRRPMEGETPLVQKAPVQEMQSVSLNPQDQPPSSSVPHIELSEEDEKRYQIVRSIGEECLKDDELRNLLAKKPNPICYDGFEPSGRMHIAQGIMKVINVNKLTSAGCQVKIWIADWFAQLNNKMGGDLKQIEVVGKYFIEIWRAAGMNSIDDKVTFLWSSEEINSRADEYWPLVMDIARRNTLARIIRCSQIMGRSETDDLTAAQILYPCMQCADIFFLKADICQLGMDQRKVNVLAREYCEQIKRKNKPIILSHRMLPGLQQGQEKMSKSDLSSSIFMEDEEAEVNVKIKKAFCPPNIVEKNPCLEYVKYIVLPWFNEFKVERSEKNGGDKTYKSFEEIVPDYESGKLHPADLKPALTKAINTILQPVRDHFKNNAEAKNILEKVKAYRVTK